MWSFNFCDCWISDYVKAKKENCLSVGVCVLVCACMHEARFPEMENKWFRGPQHLNLRRAGLGFYCTGVEQVLGLFVPWGEVAWMLEVIWRSWCFHLLKTGTQYTVFPFNLPYCDTLSCLAGMVVFSQSGLIPDHDMSVGNLTLCAGSSSPEPSVTGCCQSATGSNSIGPSGLL